MHRHGRDRAGRPGSESRSNLRIRAAGWSFAISLAVAYASPRQRPRAISLILLPLGSVALALTVCAPGALTATIQPPVSEGGPTQKDGFYPKSQLPLTCKLKDGTVLKSLVKPDHLEVQIERPGLRPVRIRLPDEFAQLNRIVPVRAMKLCPSGWPAVMYTRSSSSISSIAISSTIFGVMSRRFRLIAFIKVYLPHCVPDVTDIVMVYDLARGADGNRPSSPGMVSDVDVGMRVSPPGTNAPDDNVGTGLRDVMFNSVTSERFFGHQARPNFSLPMSTWSRRIR
jgi:hypothetical protein